MRVAVASHDGHGVASGAAQARFLLVFPVDNDRVGDPEVRTLFGKSMPLAEVSRAEGFSRWEPGNGNQFVAFPSPGPLLEIDLSDDLPVEILEAILDCQVLIAQTLSPRQIEQCAHLGLLPLAVSAPGSGAEVVRFVVSGTPPHAGSGCEACPASQASLPKGPQPVAKLP